jgi:CheY-like chemotaxis protein
MAVDCVDGAPEALSRLRDAVRTGAPYDLGVLDLCMPGIDGLELAQQVGSDHELAATSVVLMTSGPAVTRARAREASIAAALTKPVLMSRLRETLERVGAQRTSERTPSGAAPGAAGRAADRPSRGTVLVVDDGKVNQIVAVGMLRHLGYDAEIAESGPAAVDAVRRRRFDAVLMDVQMPGMDGYAATAEIRRLEAGGPRTPVIAMTATAGADERERCLAAGMDDYQAKPVTKASLARVLEQWVPDSV